MVCHRSLPFPNSETDATLWSYGVLPASANQQSKQGNCHPPATQSLLELPPFVLASEKSATMLKNDALNQLAQLKQSIRAAKELVQGRVRGTNGRFGFVVLDDGREAFLPPEAMQRVLPGDRVEVSLNETQPGKLEAELEKLISTELREFVGQYVVRGQGHFVQPDMPQFNRWIFLPPKNRGQAKDGDYLRCKISRHPFDSEGKAQARVLERIGSLADAGIEHSYIRAKFELPFHWTEATQQEARAAEEGLAELATGREDLTDLPFVTIDAPTTRDMDDALYAEVNEEGWTLYTAIADPTSLIAEGSALDLAAQTRANTVYLPGEALTMLPENLSHRTFSLVENEIRPALVCRMEVGKEGTIHQYQFSEALIRSHQKLSYEGVAAQTQGLPSEVKAELTELVSTLYQLAQARQTYRGEHALLMEDRADYDLVLNAQRKIETIEKRERNNGHLIVEEAMLATNCCAGELLAQSGGGLLSSHGGFREERLADAKTLIGESVPTLADTEITSLEGYRAVIRALHQDPALALNLGALKRMLRPSELTGEDKPHLGLGLEHYATVTSPIRRYNDYHNHRVLKAISRGEKSPAFAPELTEKLQAQIFKGRQACRQMEQWLVCQYMQDKLGQTFEGKVALVNSQGIGVRLDENGVDGFVLMRTKQTKPEFDQVRLKLTLDGQSYQPDQPVTVKITGIDLDRRRIEMALVNDKN